MNINELTIDFSLPLDADIIGAPIVDSEGDLIGHEKNTVLDAVLDRADLAEARRTNPSLANRRL